MPYPFVCGVPCEKEEGEVGQQPDACTKRKVHAHHSDRPRLIKPFSCEHKPVKENAKGLLPGMTSPSGGLPRMKENAKGPPPDGPGHQGAALFTYILGCANIQNGSQPGSFARTPKQSTFHCGPEMSLKKATKASRLVERVFTAMKTHQTN